MDMLDTYTQNRIYELVYRSYFDVVMKQLKLIQFDIIRFIKYSCIRHTIQRHKGKCLRHIFLSYNCGVNPTGNYLMMDYIYRCYK